MRFGTGRIVKKSFSVGWIVAFAMGLGWAMTGCGSTAGLLPPEVTSVTPSRSGEPNSVVSLGTFEFVSVQGTGQIFTYNLAKGTQVAVGQPYATPCTSPSGMVIASVAGANVMAVPCYDTGALLTLSVHADGTLSPLGSVGGFGIPYPGIALDGTNVLIPVFGVSRASNGGVAKISIAAPGTPVVTGTAMLANPVPGGFANPGFLTVAGGNVFVSAGSESGPQETSSTIQVVNEATMKLVGSPFVVLHSPQRLAVSGNVAYVVIFDAAQLESIDVSDPANPKLLEIVSLAVPFSSCHAIPILVRGSEVYIGCYAEGVVKEFDVSNASNMRLVQSIAGIAAPEDFSLVGNDLLVTGAVTGGQVFAINMGPAQ